MVQVRSRFLRIESRERLGPEHRSPGIGFLREDAAAVFDVNSWSVGRLTEQGFGFLNVHEALFLVLCPCLESLHRAVVAEFRGILEPDDGDEGKQQDEANDVSRGRYAFFRRA